MNFLNQIRNEYDVTLDQRIHINKMVSQFKEKVQNKCFERSENINDFRKCASPRINRLNDVDVEIDALKEYGFAKYRSCKREKRDLEECKEEIRTDVLSYFNELLARYRKKEEDPEPFIDFDALDEMVGGDDDDDDEDYDDDEEDD